MRLERLSFAGLGPFQHPVEIPFATLPGPLVAVAGDIGEGKSLLLELALPAVAWRDTPTRGPLASLLTAREGYLEATIVNGKRWTVRHTVRRSGKKIVGESVVLDEEGRPAYEGTGLPSFDAWAAQTLPPPGVLYATQFLRQRRPGVSDDRGATLVDMRDAARKSTFLSAIRADELERHAATERARKATAERDLATLDRRIANEVERAAGRTVETMSAALDAARTGAGDATIALTAARAHDAAYQAGRAAHEAAVRAARAAEERRVDLMGRLTAARERVEDLQRRRADVATLLGRAAEVHAAHARLGVLDEAIEACRGDAEAEHREAAAAQLEADRADLGVQAETRRADAAKHRLDAQRASLVRQHAEVRARLHAREQRAQEAHTVLAEEPAIRAAVDRQRGIDQDLAALDAELGALRAEIRAADARAAEGRRVAADTGAMADAAERRRRAAEARLADRTRVEAAVAELPGALDALRGAEAALADHTSLVEAARASADVAFATRHAALLAALHRIADGARGAGKIARAAIEADAEAAETATEDGRRAAEVARGEAVRARDDARARVDALRPLATRGEEMAATVDETRRAEQDGTIARAALARARVTVAAAEQETGAARAQVAARERTRAALAEERTRIAVQAARAPELEAAAAQRAEALRAAGEHAREVESIEAQIGALAATDPEELEARRAAARARVEREAAERRALDHRDAAERVEVRRLEREAERAACAELAAQREALAGATERVAVLDAQIRAEETDLANVGTQLDGVVVPPLPPAPGDGAVVAAELAAAERHVSETTTTLALAEEALRAATDSEARLRQLQEERTRAIERVDDANALIKGLGWVVSDCVDAAGPTLTTMTNKLLHTCLSSRWTVEVKTQRPHGTEPRMLECCDFLVHDALKNREGNVETYSGGEASLIGEALALSFTLLACQRAHITRPTLVRDESGSTLSPRWAKAWVQMLRLAAEEIGAGHVLFVSHTPETWALADCRIKVEGGAVEIDV